MLYIIYQLDKPDSAEIRAAQRPAHFRYLEEHQDILVLGGALLADDDTTTDKQRNSFRPMNRSARPVSLPASRLRVCAAGNGTRPRHRALRRGIEPSGRPAGRPRVAWRGCLLQISGKR
jgi:hypothetical protein